MTKVFISYRRSDAFAHAGRLFDALKRKFGDDQVFMDVEDIRPGFDFAQEIESAVGACDAALVVIGPSWTSCVDETGQRRLEQENDFVRLEVSSALKRKVPVTPVRVGGAKLPKASELPSEIAGLVRNQDFELRDTRWEADVADLLRKLAQGQARMRMVWRLAAAALVVGFAIAGVRQLVASEPANADEEQTDDPGSLAAGTAHPARPSAEACQIADGALTLFDFTRHQAQAWLALDGKPVGIASGEGCLDAEALRLEFPRDSAEIGVGAEVTLAAEQRAWQGRDTLHLAIQLADGSAHFDDFEMYVELQGERRSCDCSWGGEEYFTKIPRGRWFDLQLSLARCTDAETSKTCDFQGLEVDKLGLNFYQTAGPVTLLVDSIWLK